MTVHGRNSCKGNDKWDSMVTTLMLKSIVKRVELCVLSRRRYNYAM
ncbi:uncharacterized protein G2W53_018250 [Senna tora]|uniref:Uncharacterized protein n=1 Tax=Senna tora TaxID=362788 RepID=A0A834TUV5_9FABA|nr:uncharacterized protein G2W53_018250 [Senna tora]